jgi:hypothetical protein
MKNNRDKERVSFSSSVKFSNFPPYVVVWFNTLSAKS